MSDLLGTRHLYLVCRDRIADDNVVPGRSDIAIRPSTRSTYERLRRLLPEPEGALLMSSPLRRCHQTGARLFANLQWEESEHLLPRAFGTWEGKTWAQIRQEDPIRAESFWSDFANSRPPGGESLRDVAERVDIFVTGLLNREGWSQAILLTHPDIIRIAASFVLETPLKNALRVVAEPLSVTHLSHSWMGWQLESLNVRPEP